MRIDSLNCPGCGECNSGLELKNGKERAETLLWMGMDKTAPTARRKLVSIDFFPKVWN